MNMALRHLAAGLAATALLTVAQAQSGPQSLPKVRLVAGLYKIDAELAKSPEQREIGLMFRPDMPANAGMLFAFEHAGQQCFWMKNTMLPLDVAFLGDDGSVVNVEHMEPLTLDGHCSVKPVRYVLEMNDGWFAKRGIKPGDKVKGLPKPPSP